jgi:hypothetical protein
MAKPADVSNALVSKNGELIVIDGRGSAWKFDFGKKVKDPADADGEKELPQPSDAQAAYVFASRLQVIDGSDYCWTYDLSTGLWAKGPKVEPIDEKDEGPWIQGPYVENRVKEEAEPTKKSKAA